MDQEPPYKRSRPVRNRTVRHMRRFLTDAAAAGAALHLAGGCPDPPPPPVDCTVDVTGSTFDNWSYWQARWIQTEGELLIMVEISLWADPSKVALLGEPTLGGATLVESEIDESSMIFTCALLEGVTSVTASAQLRCEDAEHTVQFVMDVRGTPQLNERVPISAVD
ncbi:MAG: hypothetical protein JSU63_07165 [Phycisphaerales bacterium]|nr:MAG: hypothetical protein JSU63_07165 [Phycisphaerales bacterium]